MCWFPITEAFHQEVIKAGHIYDGDISPADICGLSEKENYLFLLSMAVLPAFQKQGISKKFSALLCEELRSIDIADIVSYAFTSGGEHFLNGLGLAAVNAMEDDIKFMRFNKMEDEDSSFDLILAIPAPYPTKIKEMSKNM